MTQIAVNVLAVEVIMLVGALVFIYSGAARCLCGKVPGQARRWAK
jgi:hypothetical protein